MKIESCVERCAQEGICVRGDLRMEIAFEDYKDSFLHREPNFGMNVDVFKAAWDVSYKD